MKLYTIHNKEQTKLLRKTLKPFDFSAYTKKEINSLIKEMRQKMKEENGIGLAANQIGLDTQVFIAQNEGKWYTVFNPKITKTYGEKEEKEEGCLSVPKKYGSTKRYEKIVLEGQDKNGKKVKIKAWGLLAHIFQHETDHINGKLFIDHATKIYEHPQNGQ